jgi:hypothetical protein
VGTGYDEVTGLGSLDVANFLTNWSTVGLPPSTITILTTTANTAIFGSFVTFTATVTTTGSTRPTGAVSFEDGGVGIGTALLNRGVATFEISTLALGQHSIIAVYVGGPNGNNCVQRQSDSGTHHTIPFQRKCVEWVV